MQSNNGQANARRVVVASAIGTVIEWYDFALYGAASALLVLLRLAQGFGAGAELAGAITYIAEYTPYRRRAFYTAIPNAATAVGLMLAVGGFALVSQLPEEQLLSWG